MGGDLTCSAAIAAQVSCCFEVVLLLNALHGLRHTFRASCLLTSARSAVLRSASNLPCMLRLCLIESYRIYTASDVQRCLARRTRLPEQRRHRCSSGLFC